jgi:hypothetical protein
VAANEAQALELCGTYDHQPEWLAGDSLEVLPTLEPGADLLFSCPPYADLERYSDDPADLSTMEWEAFVAAHRAIIAASVALLAPDRFAVWVVGEVRGDDPCYRGLVPETVAAFQAAGCRYYGEGILVTAIGSLALRAARVFTPGRKLGKTHQNVLVFVKGGWHEAADACEPVAEMDPAALFGTPLDLGEL